MAHFRRITGCVFVISGYCLSHWNANTESNKGKKAYKVMNDFVHGHIEVHPLCVKIIDTVQFQRLRQIKQLGLGYLVFPSASHNRFEHSIGVSHLAGKFARRLQKEQPELGIDEKDILCVEIAGLCHDLGHGPFSHVFDGKFMPKFQKDGNKFVHEKASVDMFDHLLEKNDLKGKFKEFKLEDEDITFIKEMIYQENKDKPIHNGRPKEKHFLYEIVANNDTAIDVDKWDYLARDCHMLGISNTFDYNRFLMFAKVLEVDGKKRICTRGQEMGNVYDIFHTRESIHRNACKHRVTVVIEYMITEALAEANEHFRITGKDNNEYKMSDACEDMEAYTKLTDNILYQLLNTKEKNLKTSRDIIKKVLERDLYKYVGEIRTKKPDIDTDEMKKEIANQANGFLSDSDFIVIDSKFDYGKKDKNPIDNMRFYSKSNPEEATKPDADTVSEMLPKNFNEKVIRVYCRNKDKEGITKDSFLDWCKQKHYKPMDGGLVLPDREKSHY